MTGSGLMNFGGSSIGMFGQQPWQKEARESAYSNLFSRRLGMSPSISGSYKPSDIYNAQVYASSYFPQHTSMGYGTTTTSLRESPFMLGLATPRYKDK